ncbi:hypothetical protein H6F47_12485 [Sphaerospermopsis sp. FACHB-1094]|uniref:hypothetical protein n=1 Tax=Sphaerospermopsis sp. FACHB-1094 TaxID=2692861 RepID=UPI001687756A|nr:hypothetical protein [Sphaerospermopsis sp. FACHB-1094]MBD2133227.1 hypothetical protein [Sphaerospermopsis sp. FACHB-1094]
MSLRPFFIASSLILSPLAAIGFESAAFAQSVNTIPLSITVPPTVSVTLTATSNASNLQNAIQLAQSGLQSTKIAGFSAATNAPSGVVITASSTNNGNLKNSNNVSIPYKLGLTQPSNPTAPSTPTFQTLGQFSHNLGGGDFDLYIEINNSGNISAGTYSDTLTLTVATSS